MPKGFQIALSQLSAATLYAVCILEAEKLDDQEGLGAVVCKPTM